MSTFYGDLETYSELVLKDGVHRYAEECEILLFSWAVDDGPVDVLDATESPESIADLVDIARGCDEIVFHKSDFDRTVLRAKGFVLPLEKMRDTLAQALAHGLPGALEKLGAILNVDVDKRKLKIGKELIQLFCKPRPKNQKLRRATRDTHPIEWQRFKDYAGYDIEAMREIHKKLPKWNYRGAELALWHLDQRINDRGIPVDLDMAAAAIRTAERVKRSLGQRATELTNGDVSSTTQRDAFLAHLLLQYGVDLPDLKGDTLERRISDPDLPWQVRELLNNRLEASRASTAKYKAMIRSANKDGRVRGTLQFCGAQRTGRWAGRLIQPQNFMRTPKYLAGEVELAAEAIAQDAADLVYPKPLEVLAAGVPWAIKAAAGRKIVSSDLSNIEGRVLAWLAGEQWKLEAFRAQDAEPDNKMRDLYIIGYAKSFGEPLADVVADYEAGGKKRQVGKVQELALGYQGSVGAFVSMAAVYRLDLQSLVPALQTIPKKFYDKAAAAWNDAVEKGQTFELTREVWMVCHAFAHMWRKANPNIVQFWWDLQDAAREAIRSPGNAIPVGRVVFDRIANWMRIRLPSGRYLCYPSPKVDENGRISYMGVNQYTKRWQRTDTYGGKLAENVTQAVSRDVLADRMPEAEARGYEIFMHVHDEADAEVPDTPEFTADELGRILTTNPSWADGLPLSASGYESQRYRKD